MIAPRSLDLAFLCSMLLSISAHATEPCTELKADAGAYQTCIAARYRQPIAQWPAPHVDADVPWREMGPLPERAPSPPDNPFSEAKRALGERLFADPKLSRSGQIACASCHEPDEAFADGRRVSFGHDRQAGKRNAPSLGTAGLTSQPFWDGRASSLEDQALMPVHDPVEMNFSSEELLLRLNSDTQYPALFRQSFASDGPISGVQVAQALATYQRSLLGAVRSTAFEQFLRGRSQRLSERQLNGLHVFRTQGRCMNCHYGPALSDDQFHNIGLSYYGRKYQDLGRYQVTGNPKDVGAFRTPSLRLLTQTAPWMHNGLFVNLRGTVAVYNMGMPHPLPVGAQKDDPLFPTTSARLRPLGLTADQQQALLEFLQTL